MTHLEAVKTLATERYLLGEMTELERHAFEDHYFDCVACAEDVRVASLMKDAVRAGLLGNSLWPRSALEADLASKTPVPAAPRPWRPAVFLPWAAAATLAVVIGYQSLRGPTGTPDGQSGIGPQAIAPITLRPATRGRATAVTPGARSDVAVFAVDVEGGGHGQLEYDLRGPGGAEVASGRAPAPPAGSPLLLLFPSRTLEARGDYTLRIRGLEGTDRGADEFHFVVTGDRIDRR